MLQNLIYERFFLLKISKNMQKTWRNFGLSSPLIYNYYNSHSIFNPAYINNLIYPFLGQ